MGFIPLTPVQSGGNIVAFGVEDTEALQETLRKHSIEITVEQHRMRISPSVFNSHDDVDRLLTALESLRLGKGK